MKKRPHLMARLRRGSTPVRFTERVELGSDVPTAPGFSADHLFRITEGGPASALFSPASMPASRLDLAPGELILGVESGAQSGVYSFTLLRWHHVVNDRLGGKPLAVAFCPRCFSGVALDPVSEGRELTFEVYGLYQGTMVMQDQQTDTIWTPFTGEAIAGPLAGKHLSFEPSFVATFSSWMSSHPESATPAEIPAPKPNARQPGEEANDRVLTSLVGTWDERLPPRTLVVGVEAAGQTFAYVFDPDRRRPFVLQDEVAGVPIAVLAPPGTWPLAYDRRSQEGQAIQLSVDGERIVDESGSTWWHGDAVAGPRAGTKLRSLPSHATEWYTWAAFHPKTEIRSPK